MIPPPLAPRSSRASAHSSNHRSDSISTLPRSHPGHNPRVPSNSKLRTGPIRHPSPPFVTIEIDADLIPDNVTATIPPSDFSLLPPRQKKLVRRHRKLLCALTAMFLVSVVMMTVGIIEAIPAAKTPNGRRAWSFSIVAMLSLATAIGCAFKGWDVYRGRKERESTQEGWVELEEAREKRERRERERERCWVAAIRGREQNHGSEPERGRSRRRASDGFEDTVAEMRRQQMAMKNYEHQASSDLMKHLRRPFTRQSSFSHNEGIDPGLAAFRSETGLNRHFVADETRQRLARKAMQTILARADLSPITPNSPESFILKNHLRRDHRRSQSSQPSNAGLPENPFDTPPVSSAMVDDPWKLDIIPARPGPRIYKPSRSHPFCPLVAQNPANPLIAHLSYPPRSSSIPTYGHIPDPTHHSPNHLDNIARPASAAVDDDDACSDSASMRERRRAQSVDRIRQWWARNKEMEDSAGKK